MDSSYDFLIIGGGLGGLISGYILSKKGFSICILEKNLHIGGTLQNFKLGDCTFSSGMHYLGSLDEGQVLYKLFRYLNILDDLKVKRMNPEGFDKFRIDNRTYTYPIGWQAFSDKMHAEFPNDKHAIDSYVKLVKKVSSTPDVYNLRTPVRKDLDTNPYMKIGVYNAVRDITSNTDLQNALCALNFVYAGDKNTSPLYMHALINNYYIQSAYRLIGGSAQIADLLAQGIMDQGGQIITGKTAKELKIEDHKLVELRTEDNQIFRSKQFISNVHPTVTLKMIEDGKVRKSFRNRISAIANTTSVFGLHLSLNPGVFPYMDYNYYHYEHNDVWAVSRYQEDRWPGFYYLYTPANKPDMTYADCISIYAYMGFDEVSQWESLPQNKRGDDYQQWKELKAKQLIEHVSSDFPLLKNNIKSWIAATPLTYRDYIGTPGGAMYGTLRDYHNPMSSYVFHKTKIQNLFFTGQNLNLHGMLGVSLSTIITCGEFVGLNQLINDINKA